MAEYSTKPNDNPTPSGSTHAAPIGPRTAVPELNETLPYTSPPAGAFGSIDASRAWDDVSRQVELLLEAWTGGEPPALAAFVPSEPAALRRLTLIELVKVDLARRWAQPNLRRRVESYLEEFPELACVGSVPCDLIYEEFFVRKQAGEAVEKSEYFRRFPRQIDELGRLLRLDDASCHSTAQVHDQRRRDLEVGQSLDDFDLLTRIGQGAFATVYLARQRSMQRLVALKVSADQGNEPQTMAQLDHPHIVRVYDQRLISSRGLRLLYMQYVPGGTLKTLVDKVRDTPAAERTGKLLYLAVDGELETRGESPAESPLRGRLNARSWPAVVTWLGSRLAAALDYAHQRGVLHRDLKPANVLVGADGSPKLADFNISFCSKVTGATPAAYFGGSLAYMSPEQLEAFNPAHAREAAELDGRSDIYSLGVVLWELLTGRRPFRDPTPDGDWPRTLAAMAARRNAGVAAEVTAELPADCPEGLSEVLLRCLAPNPSDRYTAARQLARQLELCLQPQVSRLLRPPRGWRHLAAQRCVLAIFLAGVLPNAFASGLNIFYNYIMIIGPLGTAAERVFFDQLIFVNSFAYPLGAGFLLAMAWPLLRGIRQRLNRASRPAAQVPRRQPTGDSWPLLRRRCLRMGDLVALVSAGEWIVSGIVFPLWLSLAPSTKDEMKTIHYVHFLASQALCGLPAALLTFFCVTFLCLRVYYPLLVEPDTPDPAALDRLQRMVPWPSRYMGWTVTMYFAATFAVLWLADSADHSDKIAMTTLSVVGLSFFWCAYLLSKEIEHDLASLSIAVGPALDPLGAANDT